MSKTIHDWINELHSSDKAIRQEASRALSYMGATAVEPLLETLQNESLEQKVLADILGKIGQPALDSLTDSLQHHDPRIREQVAQILALIADSRTVLPLVIGLDDTSDSVRAAVATALGSFSDPRAVEPLITVLVDVSPQVRSQAAIALGSYYRDPRVIPALLKVADDDDPLVRSGAARAMAQVRDDRIKAKLQTMTSDADSDVRLVAAAALQHQEGDRMVFERMSRDVSEQIAAIKELMLEDDTVNEGDMDLLRHSNPRVRAQLLEVVGELKSEKAVKLILPGLKDINPAVRQSAVDALIRLGANATDALLEALHDDSKYVRAGAVEALGVIGDARAFEALCSQIQDESELVRRAAAEALAQFSGQAEVVKALKRALKDADKEVRENAEKSLTKLGIATSNPLSRFLRRFTGNNSS